MGEQGAIFIVLSSFVFAVFHSLTASLQLKSWGYRHGLKEPYYRLLYSLVSIVTTALWLWFIHSLVDMPLYHIDGFARVSLLAIQWLGVGIALAAFVPIDGAVFLGLRKSDDTVDPFIVRGVYQYMRHPMYVGAMLILLAKPEQTWNGLVFSLCVCVYFIIGARFEEKRMLQEHADYADYQREVPAFIPKIGG